MSPGEFAEVSARLRAGVNGDADDRAATELLIGHETWVRSLYGTKYIVEHTVFLSEALPDGSDAEVEFATGELHFDWYALREDLAVSDAEDAVYMKWAEGPGRYVSEADHDRKAPPRGKWPWNIESGTAVVMLRCALTIAPGGLLGSNVCRFDQANRELLRSALNDVVDSKPEQPYLPLAIAAEHDRNRAAARDELARKIAGKTGPA